MAVGSLKVAVDDIGLPEGTAGWIKHLLWTWLARNGDKEVRLSFFGGLIRKTFRIRELHAVFALLLGPAPE